MVDTAAFLKKIAENKDDNYIHRIVSYRDQGGYKVLYASGSMRLSHASFLTSAGDVWLHSPSGFDYPMVVGAGGGLRQTNRYVVQYMKAKYVLVESDDFTFSDYFAIAIGSLQRKIASSKPIKKIVKTGFLGLFKKEVTVGWTPVEYQEEGSFMVFQLIGRPFALISGMRDSSWFNYDVILPREEAETFLNILKKEPKLFVKLLFMVDPDLPDVPKDPKEVYLINNYAEFLATAEQFLANRKKIASVLHKYQKEDDRDYQNIPNFGDFVEFAFSWIRKMIAEGKQEKIKEIIKILDNWQ